MVDAKESDPQFAELTERIRKVQSETVVQDPNYETPHDAQFKVIIIGDSGVGKSCLM